MIAQSLIIGCVIGIVVGALGAGGGILSVPALFFLLGYSAHDAATGSLIIVGLTALVSLIFRARHHEVNWKTGAIFGVVSCVGTVLGTHISYRIDGRALMFSFAILLAVVGIAMLWQALQPPREESAKQSGASEVVLSAIGTGILTGLFGVGGGFMIVPALLFTLNLPIRQASGTSLLVMTITSATGLLARIPAGISLDWSGILLFALASMAGGLVGGPLTSRVSSRTLTIFFAALLLAISIYTGVTTALG